ncbi:MarR family winged helix-turn-helix transcriptional regulator [Longispora albida]|uniref:MarR family winged helix-turn-helix transcriptional regulator n=1 Tax=Longispora albida TaxID=203523 RepID=UPI001B7FBD81|nr:MarR family transcriptional regulator [Longispora albida]
MSRAETEWAVLAATQRVIADALLFSHEVAEKLGLGPSDSQFMTLLEVHGPLTPGRLAELSGLTTGTVTGVIDRLEKAGFVRRDRAPDDRRKVIVSRDDEQVAKVMAPMYAEKGQNLFTVLSQFSDEELTTIARFMTAVAGS